MKTDLLERLWRAGVVLVRREPVTLKAGRKSHVYVNFRSFACSPAGLDTLLGLFGGLLENFAGKAALGAVPSLLSPVLAGAAAARFSLPLVLCRPGDDEKGIAGSVFAAQEAAGLPLLLLDDVLSSGGTIRAVLPGLAAAGFPSPAVVVLVDKRQSSLAAGDDLPVRAAATLASLLRFGLDSGLVPAELRDFAAAELRFQES